MFTTKHFIWIGICILFILIMNHYAKKEDFTLQNACYFFMFICLLSETTKMMSDMIPSTHGGMHLNPQSLPFHICSILLFIAAYITFGKDGPLKQKMINFFAVVGTCGGTAVFGTYAPFLQRTYDQLSHDLCLNDNPAVMLVLSPGVYGMNSNTHIALCDIQMFAHIPNLIYLAPTTKEEYEQMFKYATTQKDHPVGIRIPASFVSSGIKDETDYSVLKNKVEIQGEKFAIFAVGCMLALAKKVAEKIKEEIGIQITVINPRFLTGLDIELLEKLKKNHTHILTLEDGELVSGYGQNIASYYGYSDIKVKNYGISKAFHTDYDPIELLAQNGMSVENLSQYIQENI